MYRVRSKLPLVLALAFIGSSAHAERLQPGSPLSGYECYSLNEVALKLTPQSAWEGKGFPPVFEGPSEESKKLGSAAGFIYVDWPLRKDNGFVRILRFEGQIAWISESAIRPLYRDPGSKGGCTLQWHGNRIQAHLDPGAKGWLFPDGHDLPEDKMRR
jgi:hypothetical protein